MSEMDGKSAPSRLWYLLALVAAVLGFAGMAGFMVPRLAVMGDQLTQVVVPGDAELALSETGSYTIFHEKRSVVDGTLFVSETVSGLRVTVRNAETGAPVPLAASAANMSYSFGNRSGASMLTFDIAESGRYRIDAAYENGRTEPRAVLAIGRNFMGSLMTTIFVSLAIAFTGAGAAAIIVFAVRRKRRQALGESM